MGGHAAICCNFPSGADDRHLFTVTRKRAGIPASSRQCEERLGCKGKGDGWDFDRKTQTWEIIFLWRRLSHARAPWLRKQWKPLGVPAKSLAGNLSPVGKKNLK